LPPPPYLALTLKSAGRFDRIVSALTIRPPSPALTTSGPQHQTTALWDTGATKSVISPAVVAALGLVPVGVTTVNHAGGNSQSPTYLVNFELPHGVTFGGVLVSEFPAFPGGFEAIIGMDVICVGDFAITNVNGQSWFSFRTPSTAPPVDFVDQWNRKTYASVGRNQPCFCGAKDGNGAPVKLKMCHGKDW
jgi:hypothetical protein